MKKLTELTFLAFVLLTLLLSGCVPAPTPIPPTFTPSPVPPTFTPEPTATVTPTPFQLSALGLPVNVDEIAKILQENPNMQFIYAATTKLDDSCGTGTHLGDVFEIGTNFDNSKPAAAISSPSFGVYAPMDLSIINIQGDSNRRLGVGTYLGLDSDSEPIYLTFIHVTKLVSSSHFSYQ